MSELLFSTAYENKFVEKLLLGHAYVLAHKHALRLFLFIFPFNSVIHIRLVLLLRDVYALAHKHPLGFFFLTLFFRSIICIRFVAFFCWRLFVRWHTNLFQKFFCFLLKLLHLVQASYHFLQFALHLPCCWIMLVHWRTTVIHVFFFIFLRLSMLLSFFCNAHAFWLCASAQPSIAFSKFYNF